MKKLLCVFLCLVLALGCSGAFAHEIEIPEVSWDFPVSLMDIQSPYAVLVNADNLLDKSFTPEPRVKVTGIKRATSAAVYLEETAAEALKAMFEAARMVTEFTYVTEKGTEAVATYEEENGMVLYLKSGYRSYGTQATTYANYLERNNNVDDGYVAKPGASEHQSGLCADILNSDFAGRPTMTQDFKWEPEAQWMKQNCDDYGFILRYTEESEATTGIKFIMGKGITLEEFTVQAQAAIEEFVARGGSIEEQLEYEYKKLNMPPASYLLDEFGVDGDVEVSLVF